jgi:voltage-gated potassium channel
MHFFRHGSIVEEHGFMILLISLALMFFLYPILRILHLGEYFLGTLIFIAIFSSSRTIGKNKTFSLGTSAFIIVSIIILRFLEILYPKLSLQVSYTSLILGIICAFFLTFIVLRHILKSTVITPNEVYGAICVYILIGLSFGLMYYLATLIDNNALFPSGDLTNLGKTLQQCIYYSFITMTSTGYGDIHPINFFARSLAISEVIIGQIYPVVLIGWLIGNLSHSHK